jgi:hypothetical protein
MSLMAWPWDPHGGSSWPAPAPPSAPKTSMNGASNRADNPHCRNSPSTPTVSARIRHGPETVESGGTRHHAEKVIAAHLFLGVWRLQAAGAAASRQQPTARTTGTKVRSRRSPLSILSASPGTVRKSPSLAVRWANEAYGCIGNPTERRDAHPCRPNGATRGTAE